MILPRAVYEFRDLAGEQNGDPLAWVKSRAAAEPDGWVPHYYLGSLATYLDEHDSTVAGYGRAADLLEARADRTLKETWALLLALDGTARVHGIVRRKFRDAQPFFERMLAASAATDDEQSKRYRALAFFNLAICQAQTRHPEDALKSLRSAIDLDPAHKKAAADHELLEPLRKRGDFQRLVKA